MNNKIIFIILLLIYSSLFSCQTTINENEKEIISVWAGIYDATFSSDGLIYKWILYSDETMEGTWLTKNGSFTISLNGTYKINSNSISFKAKGLLSLPNKEKTNYELLGYGVITTNKGNGNFKLTLESPNYPDDYGIWDIIRIKEE